MLSRPRHRTRSRSPSSPVGRSIYQIGQRSGQQNPFDKLETAGRGWLDTQHGRVLESIAVQGIWALTRTRQARGRWRVPEDGEAAGSDTRRVLGFNRKGSFPTARLNATSTPVRPRSDRPGG